jgi:KAP family P-loop domain
VIILSVIYIGWILLGLLIFLLQLFDYWLQKIRSSNLSEENQSDKALYFFDNPKNTQEKNHNEEEIQKMEDLWYRQIAQQLAQRLKWFKSNDSSEVIGIEWEWGSGKTSFIKLLQYYTKLKHEISFPNDWIWFKLDNSSFFKYKAIRDYIHTRFFPQHPPSFLEFNPWYFESTTNLLESFFSSLSEHIVSEYHIPTSSLFWSFVQSIWIETEHEIFGVKFKWWNTPTSPWYTEKRNEINEVLVSLDYPIIIIIDDLDRISLEQCKQIFQLIYLCVDFKNIHFLVSYDSAKFNSIDIPTFQEYDHEWLLISDSEYSTGVIKSYIEKIIHTKIIIVPHLSWMMNHFINNLIKSFRVSVDSENKYNLILTKAVEKLFFPTNFLIYKDYISTPRQLKRLSFIIDEVIRDKENIIYEYSILKNEQRMLLFFKVFLIFINHYENFKDIFQEIQSWELSSKSDHGPDTAFHKKGIFMNYGMKWIEWILGHDNDYKSQGKPLCEYLKKLPLPIKNVITDIVDIIRSSESEDGKNIDDVDMKIIIGAITWFYSMEDSYLVEFWREAFEYYSLPAWSRLQDLYNFFVNIENSQFYLQLSDGKKKIFSGDFIIKNKPKIYKSLLEEFMTYLRDSSELSVEYVQEFFVILFHRLKDNNFWNTTDWKSLLMQISDEFWMLVYSLIFWIENQSRKESKDIAQLKWVLKNIFNSENLYENWWIFWVSYLLRLWRWFAEQKGWFYDDWKEWTQENVIEWSANFVYEIFKKYYIDNEKTFLVDDKEINKRWKSFIQYQFMSVVNMGNITIKWTTEKIGDAIGKYFQKSVFNDSISTEQLFEYVVSSQYRYTSWPLNTGIRLIYSYESDWYSNEYMNNILKYFYSEFQDYVNKNSTKEIKIDWQYSWEMPRDFTIFEIWENLKKVTKLDEE